MRAFRVRLPSGAAYWTVLDEDLAVVSAADAFSRSAGIAPSLDSATPYSGAPGMRLIPGAAALRPAARRHEPGPAHTLHVDTGRAGALPGYRGQVNSEARTSLPTPSGVSGLYMRVRAVVPPISRWSPWTSSPGRKASRSR